MIKGEISSERRVFKQEKAPERKSETVSEKQPLRGLVLSHSAAVNFTNNLNYLI